MSHFFIDRPIFAWVIAIIIMLAGLLGIYTLPVAQYPDIAPPEVTIMSIYNGASAQTVEDSVTQVIEQQITGIDNLDYMSSTSDASGMSRISLTFKAGTDPDIAQMQVQNKIALVTSMMPDVVQRNGIRVMKSSASFFLMIGLVNTDKSMTFQDLGDFAVSNLQDPLSRIEGIGEVQMFGSQYAMRIWTDPAKLAQYNLNTSDLIAAIQMQNNDINAGYIGGAPAVQGQMISFSVTAQARMNYIEQFENVIIRMGEDGSMVKLKDVAWMQLAGETSSYMARYGGNPAAGGALRLATGANAIGTADRVFEKMEELAEFFPPNIKWEVAFDTTPFVRISMYEVVKTLIEAIVLVFFLMYLFLQDIRATIIPTIAVPVVLLGTFAVMAAAQFSINTLTMFGMVLAIGLLVDDAIVVVENVERLMHDEKLSPYNASKKSMTQITGALVGIGLVLSAVFVPMAFFGGSTGVIYRQFSITIVSAMLLSVVVALVLTPSLCATVLKNKALSTDGARAQLGVFGRFNRGFDAFVGWYTLAVSKILSRYSPALLIYAVIFVTMCYGFVKLPTSFLPDEDQGVIMCMIQLPEGAAFERTIKVMEQVEKYFLEDEKEDVASIMSILGFSFGGSGQNVGMAFVQLKDWEERTGKENKVAAIVQRAFGRLIFTGEGMVFVLQPPAIMELGTSSGFDMQLVDRGGRGREEMQMALAHLMGKVAQEPRLTQVRTSNRGDTAQYKLDIDWEKASAQNLLVNDVITTLSSLWGGVYVNNFVDRGRTKKVMMQADAPYRMQPDDFNRIYIRNTRNEMVPFSSIASGSWVKQAPFLERFNGVSAMQITGQGAGGVSSGESMDIMENMVGQLAAENFPGFGVDWSGLSFQEKQSSTQAPALYAISLLVVFLCLAALYESWSIPISVMLVVPLGVAGALGAAYLFGMNNDVYFQVALLTIIGLSAKNAILIVEFAKDLEAGGMELIEATIEACRLRLRPILMTSLAFMLGVTPLAISTGAGSGGQNAIGLSVLGGMTTATMLGIFFIPVFFVMVSKIFKADVKNPHMRKQAW